MAGSGAGMTKETATGVSDGAVARCSSASWAPDWYSAHWTGFSLSISAQGMSPIAIFCAGAFASCGQAYVAIAIPEVKTVMTRKLAIRRQKDE